MQFEQGLRPLDPVIDITERFHTALIRVLPLLCLHSHSRWSVRIHLSPKHMQSLAEVRLFFYELLP